MEEITKETITSFIKEYEELCAKYNLTIGLNNTGALDLFKLSLSFSEFTYYIETWRKWNET